MDINKAKIKEYDQQLDKLNNNLLDIAHELKEHFDLEESVFAIMKIMAASKDIHNIRIKLINRIDNGIQQQ